jgi:hypothetical protein
MELDTIEDSQRHMSISEITDASIHKLQMDVATEKQYLIDKNAVIRGTLTERLRSVCIEVIFFFMHSFSASREATHSAVAYFDWFISSFPPLTPALASVDYETARMRGILYCCIIARKVVDEFPDEYSYSWHLSHAIEALRDHESTRVSELMPRFEHMLKIEVLQDSTEMHFVSLLSKRLNALTPIFFLFEICRVLCHTYGPGARSDRLSSFEFLERATQMIDLCLLDANVLRFCPSVIATCVIASLSEIRLYVLANVLSLDIEALSQCDSVFDKYKNIQFLTVTQFYYDTALELQYLHPDMGYWYDRLNGHLAVSLPVPSSATNMLSPRRVLDDEDAVTDTSSYVSGSRDGSSPN